MRDAVADAAVPGRLLAPGPDFREPGILVDLDAPALVLGQVPVEHVLLVHRHQVDELHDLLLREEEAAAVEQRAPVPEGGFILDGAARNRPFSDALCPGLPINFRGKKLHDSLQAVEGAVHLGGLDADAFRCHLQAISFLAESPDFPQDNLPALAGKAESRGQGHLGPEIIGDFLKGAILHHKAGRAVQDELTGGLDKGLGQRDQVITRPGRQRGGTREQARDNPYDSFHGHSASMVSRMVSITPAR